MYTQLVFIENIELENNVGEFGIYHGSYFIDRLPNEFFVNYGKIMNYQLKTRGIIFRKINRENLPDGHYDLHSELAQIFTFGTWLIKDMSVYTSRSLLFDVAKEEYHLDMRNVFLSRADGTYKKEKINLSILVKAGDLLGRLGKILTTSQRTKIENGEFNYAKSINTIDYSLTNRIDRALNFVFSARETNVVLKKISWYIVALEALFSDGKSNKDIKQKLMARVSSFIGVGNKDRERLKSDINSGFSLRSAFLHGSETAPKKSAHIMHVRISESLDSMIRKTLVSIICDAEIQEIFGDQTKFMSYFKVKARK
ncbi:hypothetical protein QE382_002131 [Sphingobacterium zeae]|uniref:Apea-like HEPN domain-containing protein n=1 Tax=Sphingobacterium zeae TaxID=1776859 RepID=A0ABU0U5B4_9SPHI|nr:HEPN domain-containing protein [Sphingobacterium zeae]MDQ1150147.1 hypothetical protein [Sphingobacterium zeae]